MKVLTRLSALVGLAAALSLSTASALAADLKVGFITSLSGPVSSLGIPYDKGMNAALAYQSEINGRKIQVIRLDDASDPSTAARDARKLIDEDKVDVIIGTAGAPGALAIAAVARETKTPLINIANADLPGADGAWMVTLPQPAPLMMDAMVEQMKKANVKTVAYIGYSDAWGDLVYDALMKSTAPAGIQVVSNERYARSDSSVAGQVLKIVALHPDAVITGASGTPGALPYLALQDRGYKGKIYGMHSLINPDFIRVRRLLGRRPAGTDRPGGGGRAAARRQPHEEGGDAVPRRLREGQRRAAHRHLLGLQLRRLADLPRCRQARPGHQGRAGHAGVPAGAARCHRRHQGAGRHAQRLQLQSQQPLRLRRPLARGGEARQGPVEAGALKPPDWKPS
jgi:ABC-type sugar transport system substrate-binding protein